MITGCEPSVESLEIGKELELALGKIRDDELDSEVIGFQFRPVNRE